MSAEQWTTVKSRCKQAKKTSGRPRRKRQSNDSNSTYESSPLEESVDAIVQKVLKVQNLLTKTQYFISCMDTIRTKSRITYERIIILGVGNFAKSPAALVQLSFGLELCLQLCSTSRGMIYDPVMTSFEQEVCAQLGLVVETGDTEIHHAPTSSLFYMPHCPYLLYNQILWKNWGDCLRNVEIIGNSFESYALRRMGISNSIMEAVDCIKLLEKLTDEFEVWRDDFGQDENATSNEYLRHMESAFNDLSFLQFGKEDPKRIEILLPQNRPSDELMQIAIQNDLELIAS